MVERKQRTFYCAQFDGARLTVVDRITDLSDFVATISDGADADDITFVGDQTKRLVVLERVAPGFAVRLGPAAEDVWNMHVPDKNQAIPRLIEYIPRFHLVVDFAFDRARRDMHVQHVVLDDMLG